MADRDRPLVLPLIAGVLALAGAALTLVSEFSDYYEDFFPSRQISAIRWFFLVYALAVIAAGVMLVTQRATQVVGAAALVAITTTFVGGRALAVYNVALPERGAGPGFSFDIVGFVLVIAAAALALVGLGAAGAVRNPWLRGMPGRAGLATAAAVAGFVTAVGFGLNPSRLSSEVPSPFGQGTPLVPSPRSLWAQLLVVVALTAWPAVAVLARRPIAAGLTLGLLAFVSAEALYRLLAAYSKIGGVDPRLDPIEGTWVFLVGGILLADALSARFLLVKDGAEIAAVGGLPAA